MWHIHIEEFYFTKNKNEIMSFSGKRMQWEVLYLCLASYVISIPSTYCESTLQSTDTGDPCDSHIRHWKMSWEGRHSGGGRNYYVNIWRKKYTYISSNFSQKVLLSLTIYFTTPLPGRRTSTRFMYISVKESIH